MVDPWWQRESEPRSLWFVIIIFGGYCLAQILLCVCIWKWVILKGTMLIWCSTKKVEAIRRREPFIFFSISIYSGLPAWDGQSDIEPLFSYLLLLFLYVMDTDTSRLCVRFIWKCISQCLTCLERLPFDSILFPLLRCLEPIKTVEFSIFSFLFFFLNITKIKKKGKLQTVLYSWLPHFTKSVSMGSTKKKPAAVAVPTRGAKWTRLILLYIWLYV
jgi:hypothetical protein